MAAAAPVIAAIGTAAGGVAALSQHGSSAVGAGGGGGGIPAGGNVGDSLPTRQLSSPQTSQFPVGPMPNVPVPAFDQSNLNQNLMSILQTLGTVKGGGN